MILQSGRTPEERLTPREREVRAAILEGLTNPQIGAKLGIAPHTVKVHVQHLFEKLGIHSRKELKTPAPSAGADAMDADYLANYMGTAPNSHPEDGGPREIAFEASETYPAGALDAPLTVEEIEAQEHVPLPAEPAD